MRTNKSKHQDLTLEDLGLSPKERELFARGARKIAGAKEDPEDSSSHRTKKGKLTPDGH